MKHTILSIFAVAALLTSCNQGPKEHTGTAGDGTTVSTEASAGATGKIEFKEEAFDFGKIKEGEVVKHVFTFTNTGEAPVILSQVTASCGCTTPSFTTTPVLPGKSGEIAVEFNSAGMVGQQQKIITVVSNSENNITTIQLKGTVDAA
ncbi:DUF1573 domain-containing protein [Sphingobacterium lactis]|uniref:DUF1573 domain-containing protein n=1 Tax=Sphingobacterium lactis TaxID=797291 RepID=A0A1H6BY95_9SPHI|nr:DUF1573 domain-containing protein [Sphingobacterium lactis]SEG65684.1 Protein of unknown function [Sphingobacterium lactis]